MFVAAVGSHGSGEAVDNAVTERREARDREIRTRDRAPGKPLDRFQKEDDSRHGLRGTLRASIRQEAQRASGVQQPGANGAVQPGPPPTWDSKAKGEWERLPDSTKVATYRDQAALAPRLRERAEIGQMLDPVRPALQQKGLSDVQAIKRLVDIEAGMRNPTMRQQTQ